jgi:ubiquinone biosynthesis monooxygenase Coq6
VEESGDGVGEAVGKGGLVRAKVKNIAWGQKEGVEGGGEGDQGLDFSGWPVLELESSAGKGEVVKEEGSKIMTRLLVGADGFNSPVRTFAGINSHGWDYDRHGVVATLKVTPSEQHTADNYSYDDADNHATAFQRFLPQLGGPIAILPLPDNHASLVWSTTPSKAAYLKSLPPTTLVHVLNAALRLSQTDLKYLFTLSPEASSAHESEVKWRLQHTPPPQISTPPPIITHVQEGSVASFPLRFRHATTLTGPRIALVGDAAHTIHPLAGQGLNLGLADAQALAETIAYSVEHGMDIGDSMALERYGSERFGKGLLMAGGVDALNWMFQLDGDGQGILSSLLGRARGLGMAAIGSDFSDQLGVKGAVMRIAEGA